MCTATKGQNKCGKRQLRGQTRNALVSNLEKESTLFYRAKKASELMGSDDDLEPPHLYSASVCRTAKYEAGKKRFRKVDPLDAISDLKRSRNGQEIVRDIGRDPVKVLFWSPHQIRVYNKLRKQSALCIDASGGRIMEYRHIDGKKSQHIFLHIAVLHSAFGQFVVSSMLTEKQDMVSITTWLLRWIQTGAQYPKEVVCDSSRALLSICCLAFATFDTVEAYADACMSNNMPRTYIRIDVAHYMKNWADFFKTEKKLVKRFISELVSSFCRQVQKTPEELLRRC
ncbi:uncharacterized protein LOC121467746 [Drosophila elegans]|uniref:uncharacterized protein LOC121467746 n=1 Tax=Drosophila elegans TaxID=30023 RepID=UPI001BC8302A|nr:uncharacterized protein LOC121467746 [Drosophila elegans]